jgi:hypothetical protein
VRYCGALAIPLSVSSGIDVLDISAQHMIDRTMTRKLVRSPDRPKPTKKIANSEQSLQFDT